MGKYLRFHHYNAFPLYYRLNKIDHIYFLFFKKQYIKINKRIFIIFVTLY